MDYLSSYTASLLEQSRFYYPPLAAMRSALHDSRAPVDAAAQSAGPQGAGSLGPLMELGLLHGGHGGREHGPLDLSMKTIRQTPDSTADDDVVILEHRRHNARQQALQLAAAMAAGKLPFAFSAAGRLGDAFQLGPPGGPPSMYDHHHLPPLGPNGPTVVVTSGGLVSAGPPHYRNGTNQDGNGPSGNGSSAFLPPAPSMHSGLCGGLNGFCLDPHRCRLASLSTAVATSAASSRPLPPAAFHPASSFAALYERHMAKLMPQAGQQQPGVPSSATGVLQSLSEMHMSSAGGAAAYPPHSAGGAATSTTDVLKHPAFSSVLAADRGYTLGPPAFAMSSLYGPQHHHAGHQGGAKGVPVSCACCLPKPYPLSCVCCFPAPGAGAGAPPPGRSHFEPHGAALFGCCPPAPGGHLPPTSLPPTSLSQSHSVSSDSKSKSSGGSKRESTSGSSKSDDKHHHHHSHHHSHHSSSSTHKSSSRHSTSPTKSSSSGSKMGAPAPRSTTPTTAPPTPKGEERRTPSVLAPLTVNNSHPHHHHNSGSNSSSSRPTSPNAKPQPEGGRWIPHLHKEQLSGKMTSTPPSTHSPSGTPPIPNHKAVRVFAPVVHIPPSPPTAASAFTLHHPTTAPPSALAMDPFSQSAALFAQAHLVAAVAAKAQAAAKREQETVAWASDRLEQPPSAKMARLSPPTSESSSSHRRHHHHHHKRAPSPTSESPSLKKEGSEVAPPNAGTVPAAVIGRWMLTPPTSGVVKMDERVAVPPTLPEVVAGNWLTTDSAAAAVAPAASHPKKSSLPPELPASPAEGCSPNGAAMAMEHKTELVIGSSATMPSPALSSVPPATSGILVTSSPVANVAVQSVSPVLSSEQVPMPSLSAVPAPAVQLCKEEQWKTPSPNKRPLTDDVAGQCLVPQPAKKKKKKDVIVISMRDEHQVHEGNQVMKSVKRKLTDEHSKRPAGAAPSPPHLAKDLHFSPPPPANPTPIRAHRNHHHRHHHHQTPAQQLYVNGNAIVVEPEAKPAIDPLLAANTVSSILFRETVDCATVAPLTTAIGNDESLISTRVLPPVGVTLVKTHHAGGSHQYKSSVLTSSSRSQQSLLPSTDVASTLPPPVEEDATTAMLRQYYEQQKQRLQDYDQRKRSESPQGGATTTVTTTLAKSHVSPSTTPPLPAPPAVTSVAAAVVSRPLPVSTTVAAAVSGFVTFSKSPEDDDAQDGDDEREDDEDLSAKANASGDANSASAIKDEKSEEPTSSVAHLLGANGVIKTISAAASPTAAPVADHRSNSPNASTSVSVLISGSTAGQAAAVKVEQTSEPSAESSSATPVPATRVENTKRLMINKALGETMLHRAARLGYLDVVNYCLESQTGSIDVRDNAGYTPLHECCSRGHLEIARQLLQHGADPNVSAAGGVQPIHDAIENDQLEIVRLLLSYGADPLIATYSGMTPEKLALSPPMKEFMKGYLADISGDYDKDILPWQFHGSAHFFDPWPTGYDPLDDLPSDGEEECAGGDPDAAGGDEEDVDDAAALVFEVSDKPHIPTYRVPTTRRNGSGTLSFCLFSDVLHQTCMDRDAFLACYPDIRVDTVSGQQFATQARCTQLMVDTPVSPVATTTVVAAGSSTAVTGTNGAAAAPWVELVRWDDTLRDILDIEQVTIPLVGI